MVTRRTRYRKYKQTRKYTTRRKKTQKKARKRRVNGGSSPPKSDTSADKVFDKIAHIKDTITPRFYPNKQTWDKLIRWIKYLGDPTINMPQYTNKRGIQGSCLLSPVYIEKYKTISEIWGYHAEPYINYEKVTHHSYKGQPLRLFQDFSDPLMRNLERLSRGEKLIPSDTVQFLSKIYSTVTKHILTEESDAEYITWFCDTVLPHFLSQSNVSTLLYELADQKWSPSGPAFDDEQVLLYLSLISRLFLLLVIKDWKRILELLEYVGINKLSMK
jgi:hypothetical protein